MTTTTTTTNTPRNTRGAATMVVAQTHLSGLLTLNHSASICWSVSRARYVPFRQHSRAHPASPRYFMIPISNIVSEHPKMSTLVPLDRQRQPNERHIRLLCIDGGGVKGLAALISLRTIMDERSQECGEDQSPWQVFHMIIGTSTGGSVLHPDLFYF